MAVYLLHSSVPLVRSNGEQVRHYLGWCPDGEVARRLHDHLRDRHSARIVQAFLRKGAQLVIGNVWQGRTPAEEQKMKHAGHLATKCYQCRIDALREAWIESLS